MSEQAPCPLCELEEQDVAFSDGRERLSLECARCGRFKITKTAGSLAKRQGLGPRLIAWIRDRFDSGVDTPEINQQSLPNIAAVLPSYGVKDKQLLLLRGLERRNQFPGQALNVSRHLDYPIAWASGEKEFQYLLRSLIDRGLLQRTDGPPELSDSFAYEMVISPAGWTFLEDHARPSVLSDQAFVAMSFSPDLKLAWEAGIHPAASKAGYRPYRTDAEPHIERIDAKIITEIKNSRLLIADVTKQRPGVYFEAGYAIGLGLPVFWCVREDDLENVHFDTRQYNHIVWKDEADLAEQLYSFLVAVVGKRG